MKWSNLVFKHGNDCVLHEVVLSWCKLCHDAICRPKILLGFWDPNLANLSPAILRPKLPNPCGVSWPLGLLHDVEVSPTHPQPSHHQMRLPWLGLVVFLTLANIVSITIPSRTLAYLCVQVIVIHGPSSSPRSLSPSHRVRPLTAPSLTCTDSCLDLLLLRLSHGQHLHITYQRDMLHTQ